MVLTASVTAKAEAGGTSFSSPGPNDRGAYALISPSGALDSVFTFNSTGGSNTSVKNGTTSFLVF